MMSFKYIYRCALCILLFAVVPTTEVNAQATQVVKAVSKWFGKKAAKEGAEEVVEQGVKAVSKDMAQKAITKNAATSDIAIFASLLSFILNYLSLLIISQAFSASIAASVQSISSQ